MASDSAGWDESAERREYLLRLRARAVERMRLDEQAVAGDVDARAVSRRSSLRWLGLAAVAAAAGARPLRALATGASGVLGSRAAMVGSLRCPAPQYGVPALPQPDVPYEEGADAPKLWRGVVQTAANRTELGEAARWTKDYPTVVEAWGEVVSGFSNYHAFQARVIFYEGPWDKSHAFAVITSGANNTTYVVPGGQTFYVEDAGELWGFLIKDATLYLRKSYFRMRSSDDPVNDAIRGFVNTVSDKELRMHELHTSMIDLSGVMGNYRGDPTIGSISTKQDRVILQCYSPQCIFTVYWRTGKVVLGKV